jgi:hypothetical protein
MTVTYTVSRGTILPNYDKWFVVRCEDGVPKDVLPIPFPDKASAQDAIDYHLKERNGLL